VEEIKFQNENKLTFEKINEYEFEYYQAILEKFKSNSKLNLMFSNSSDSYFYFILSRIIRYNFVIDSFLIFKGRRI
jgi:hypothetical protein